MRAPASAERSGCAGQVAGVGRVADRVARAVEPEADRVHHVVRGGEGADRDARDLEGYAGDELAEGELVQVSARARRADARIQLDREGAVPHGDAAHVVGVLVGEQQGAHVVLVEAEGVHACEHLAAGKAVVDHDEALRALDQRAVSLRPASQDVQPQGPVPASLIRHMVKPSLPSVVAGAGGYGGGWAALRHERPRRCAWHGGVLPPRMTRGPSRPSS